MNESHICDHCKDPRNLVTRNNGDIIVSRAGGQKRTVAYVHESCKEGWGQNHSGTTFDALTYPTLEKKIRCTKCGKEFEIVGSQGNEKEMRTIVVSCPCDNCGQFIEVRWPKNQKAFVRKIPSEA